jgi:hypothetical protein
MSKQEKSSNKGKGMSKTFLLNKVEELEEKIARLEKSIAEKNKCINDIMELQVETLELNDSLSGRAARCSMELVDLQGKMSKIYLVVSEENTIFNRRRIIRNIKQILNAKYE